jgi:hypothetical protein
MWWERIAKNASRFRRSLAFATLGTRRGWAAYALMAAVMLGLLICVRRKTSILVWFAPAYAGLILIYFTFHNRLLIPIVPFVYAYILVTLRWMLSRLGRWIPRRKIVPVIEVIAVACLLTLNLRALPRNLNYRQGDQVSEPGAYGALVMTCQRAADWLSLNTTEDATALTEPAPILSLLSGRDVYTTRFQSIPRLLAHHKIDFAVCSWWTTRAEEAEFTRRAKSKWTLARNGEEQPVRIYHLSDAGLLPEVDMDDTLRPD